jgi:hypothetical protein
MFRNGCACFDDHRADGNEGGRTVARPRSGEVLKTPAPLDQDEDEKLHRFAVRASSILAFVECPEAQRPKLRDAIVEAMLWAQTQPKPAE